MSSEEYGHFVTQQHRILPSDITITEAIHTFCITDWNNSIAAVQTQCIELLEALRLR